MSMKRIKIAPSILAADFGRLAEEARAAEATGADWLHLDVMDGAFVPNITFGPDVVKALRKAVRIPLDVHLMVDRPERYVEAFAEAGADIITVHQEATIHLDRTLSAIRALGKKAGVALNPSTPETTLAYVLDKIDLVCVMTVNPGFGGQSFIPGMLSKVARLKMMTVDYDIAIEIDGGVNAHNAAALAESGANILVAGSSVYAGGDSSTYAPRIEAIRDSAERAIGLRV
jgi:ribulose-phosphate 3-epimerase